MYSKELLKGTLSTIVLSLLAEHGRMYGYEIFQTVKELSDGKILLKDGSLYPTLQKLSKQGLLSHKEEFVGKRVRKYYFLTEKGRKVRSDHLDELRDFIYTLQKVVFKDYQTA